MREILLESTLVCPECGLASTETMPTDRCVWYWECPGCGALARPKAGDCCVYCSYGSVPCPPAQQEEGPGGCNRLSGEQT